VKPRRWLRYLGGLALAAVLLLGFVGYLSPDMRLNWESVAAMCGF
ncbi:hypothetical protein BAV0911A, partial [Bordetella avium 197N]